MTDLLEPTVKALGLELWGIEYLGRGKQSVLRIFIDSDQGITVEDCEKVSRQLSSVLDVEDPIAGEYRLEISSPGTDRRLFAIAHFEKYIGNEVNVKLRTTIDGRRKVKGTISGVKGDTISVLEDGVEFLFPFVEIDKAHLVF